MWSCVRTDPGPLQLSMLNLSSFALVHDSKGLFFQIMPYFMCVSFALSPAALTKSHVKSVLFWFLSNCSADA